MRIYSNLLTLRDLSVAASDVSAPGTTPLGLTVSEHKSRTHARAFEVALHGNSKRRNASNTGQAATWDEWGVFFANLYHIDPEMKCRAYVNGDAFHDNTCGRFEARVLPSDTHSRHRWELNREQFVFECSKCSAVRVHPAFH